MNVEQQLAQLQGQIEMLKSLNPALFKHGDLAGGTPNANPPLNEDLDGFFQDCTLDLSIVNATLSPRQSLFNSLPVRSAVVTERSVGFITAIDDGVTGSLPATPCDPGQVINDAIAACKISYPFNRYDVNSKTMEVDEIIERACREGVFDDFLFLGNINPLELTRTNAEDQNIMRQGVVRRQMSMIGRRHQAWSLPQLWIGDPANSNVGGGYKESIGLLNLITDDYDTNVTLAPYLTGSGGVADCAALNSDIKDFDACIGGVNGITNQGIWAYLQTLVETLTHKADLLGLMPVEWKFVMRASHWNELLKVLPCEMAGDGCQGVAVGDNTTITLNDSFNLEERRRMQNAGQIVIGGVAYDVIIDNTIPYTNDPDANSEQASIFFIPFRVQGEDVIWLEHKDYSVISQRLSPISDTQVQGFSDGGRFHWIVIWERRCFEIDAKSEWRLVFKAPHLAGRIDNVSACRIQPHAQYFPAS